MAFFRNEHAKIMKILVNEQTNKKLYSRKIFFPSESLKRPRTNI
jgi:hypothetical protein